MMVIHDDDSSGSSGSSRSSRSSRTSGTGSGFGTDSDGSMLSVDSSLSSVVSVYTDSSVHLDSSPFYIGYSDESADEVED